MSSELNELLKSDSVGITIQVGMTRREIPTEPYRNKGRELKRLIVVKNYTPNVNVLYQSYRK